MKYFYVLALFFVLLVVAVFGQFYLRKEASDEAWQATANAHLEQLLVIDGNINESMVKTRFNLELNYDNLANNTRAFSDQLRALLRHLGSKQSVLDAVQWKIDRLRIIFENKKDVIESFKSHNSVLRNSVIYTPAVGEELIDLSSRLPEAMQLEKSLYELNTNILKYSHSNFDERPEIIKRQLDNLRSEDYTLPDFASLAYSEFSNHVQTVLNEKPSTEQYLASALLIPVKDEVLEIKGDLFHLMRVSNTLDSKIDYLLIAYFAIFTLSFLLLAVLLYNRKQSIDTAVRLRTQEVQAENVGLKKSLEDLDSSQIVSEGGMQALQQLDNSLGQAKRNLSALQFQVVEVNRLIGWIKKLSDSLTHGNVDKTKANELLKKVVIHYRDLHKRSVFDGMQSVLKDSAQDVQEARNVSLELGIAGKAAGV